MILVSSFELRHLLSLLAANRASMSAKESCSVSSYWKKSICAQGESVLGKGNTRGPLHRVLLGTRSQPSMCILMKGEGLKTALSGTCESSCSFKGCKTYVCTELRQATTALFTKQSYAKLHPSKPIYFSGLRKVPLCLGLHC